MLTSVSGLGRLCRVLQKRCGVLLCTCVHILEIVYVYIYIYIYLYGFLSVGDVAGSVRALRQGVPQLSCKAA